MQCITIKEEILSRINIPQLSDTSVFLYDAHATYGKNNEITKKGFACITVDCNQRNDPVQDQYPTIKWHIGLFPW